VIPAELPARLTAAGVAWTDDLRQRTVMSSDWSRMSPVLAEKLPVGRYVADLVVRPADAGQVAAALRIAHALDVPVTPRGAGTGNYGQATPFDGGILLDLRGLDTVVVGDTTVTCGAGARLTAIDRACRAAGRDLWMFPSTKSSTIGGFVAGGSAGTGTVEHRTTSDGFVVAAVVAPMDGSGRLVRVTGEELVPFVHVYGVTGVLVEVEVRTDPAREWSAVYASFDSYAALVAAHRGLLALDEVPRLASGDEPPLVASLTTPLDPDRWSLRVIVPTTGVAALRAHLEDAGGLVVGTVDDYAETDRLSGMSYNHPVWFFQRAHPDETWFHLETSGMPLWDRPDEVRAVYDGDVWLHLELFAHGPGAMLVARYTGEAELVAGMARLEALGVGVHSPHQWYVDRSVELARDTARATDPKGLLNPGKLVAGVGHDSRVNIGVVR
jgi:FAD/FMN-containing dehydrogenase